jgi:hypothetical protein
VLPADIAPANVRVQLNGSDITSAFALRPNSRFMGLVEGLNLGDNELRGLRDERPEPAAQARRDHHHQPCDRRAGLLRQAAPAVDLRAPRRHAEHAVTVPGTNLTGLTTTRASGLNDDPVNDQCDAPPTLAFFYQPAIQAGDVHLRDHRGERVLRGV